MPAQTQATKMGFDILIWGVLLLLCPIYRITDAVAAVLLIVAYRKSGKYLPDMLRAEKFSFGFLAIGILEIIFGYIFPMEMVLSAISIVRAAVLMVIFLCTVRGVRDLAQIAEDAILYDRAAGLIKPIYIISAAKMLSLVVAEFFPVLSPLLICAKVCDAVLVLMIFQISFKCYKDINIYPAAVADEDDEELS